MDFLSNLRSGLYVFEDKVHIETRLVAMFSELPSQLTKEQDTLYRY